MSFRRSFEDIKRKKEEMRTSVFKGAEMIWVLWETKQEIIDRVLPHPLEPIDQPIALAFVANYPSHSYGLPYTEAALILRCQFKGELGNYFLAMPLTDDRATFAGREIWGFPKKMANVHFEKRNNEIYGYSERLGVKNIEIELTLTGKFNEEETPKIVSDIQMIPNEMFPGEIVAEVDPEKFLPYSYIKWDWY
mgnify:CR=1 FL=1